MKKDAKKKNNRKEDKKKQHIRWIILLFVMTLLISAAFSFLSQRLLQSVSLIGAFAVLLIIVAIGVLFDALGVAVTAADEKPFHSMAARKVPGAVEAIKLLRNAGRVSSVCNDVVGDICGIISGAAAAAVAIRALIVIQSVPETLLQLFLSALVAALTIGGKAAFKTVALENSTAIVHGAARVIYFFKHPFPRKKSKS